MIAFFVIFPVCSWGISDEPVQITRKKNKKKSRKKKTPSHQVYYEPFVLESVHIQNYRHSMDFGLNMGLDKFSPKNMNQDVINQSYGRLCLSIDYRFAPTQDLELSFRMPYLVQTLDYSGSVGDQTSGYNATGLGQLVVGCKVPLSKHFGLKGFTELPTGDVNSALPSGEGANFGVMFLARAGSWHFGLGRIVKLIYPVHYPHATLRRDPGDITVFSLALTNQDDLRFKGNVYVQGIFEINNYFIHRDQVNGVKVKDTNGIASHMAVGFVLGNLRGSACSLTKMGAVFSLGEESHQNFDIPRGMGDFQLFLSYEYRWGKTSQ